MMDVKKIKLRKERVDEFTVRHWFDAGTKYLGAVYATKHYQYDIYDADGKRLTFMKYNNLYTLKDVKNWIANYDDEHEAQLAYEQEEKDRQEREWKERRDREDGLTEAFIAPVEEAKEYKVGDMITVLMGTLSKPDAMGEALDRIEAPHAAKVMHITEVTAEEFDAAAKSIYNGFKKEWLLLEGDEEHKFGGGYVGGYASDEPVLQDKEWTDLDRDPELKALWYATNYVLATLIIAPGRQPMVVDTSGYGYPRYAGKIA